MNRKICPHPSGSFASLIAITTACSLLALIPIAAQSHQTAMPAAWYDAIADLGDRLRTSPQDSTLKNRWRALLTLIHAEDLADKPFVGSMQPIER